MLFYFLCYQALLNEISPTFPHFCTNFDPKPLVLTPTTHTFRVGHWIRQHFPYGALSSSGQWQAVFIYSDLGCFDCPPEFTRILWLIIIHLNICFSGPSMAMAAKRPPPSLPLYLFSHTPHYPFPLKFCSPLYFLPFLYHVPILACMSYIRSLPEHGQESP